MCVRVCECGVRVCVALARNLFWHVISGASICTHIACARTVPPSLSHSLSISNSNRAPFAPCVHILCTGRPPLWAAHQFVEQIRDFVLHCNALLASERRWSWWCDVCHRRRRRRRRWRRRSAFNSARARADADSRLNRCNRYARALCVRRLIQNSHHAHHRRKMSFIIFSLLTVLFKKSLV